MVWHVKFKMPNPRPSTEVEAEGGSGRASPELQGAVRAKRVNQEMTGRRTRIAGPRTSAFHRWLSCFQVAQLHALFGLAEF